MHHYYVNPDKAIIDIAKVRDDAQTRLDGKGPYKGFPEESVIHHHRHDPTCHLISLDPVDPLHELYTFDRGVLRSAVATSPDR